MDWHERIVVNPKVLAGKPVIKRTRIAVEFVLDLLGRGWTTEQILREHDHLSPEDIQALPGQWRHSARCHKRRHRQDGIGATEVAAEPG